jgi:hypothetical protein
MSRPARVHLVRDPSSRCLQGLTWVYTSVLRFSDNWISALPCNILIRRLYCLTGSILAFYQVTPTHLPPFQHRLIPPSFTDTNLWANPSLAFGTTPGTTYKRSLLRRYPRTTTTRHTSTAPSWSRAHPRQVTSWSARTSGRSFVEMLKVLYIQPSGPQALCILALSVEHFSQAYTLER